MKFLFKLEQMLTVEHFRNWLLDRLDNNLSVGLPRSPCNCPIAQYVRSLRDGSNVTLISVSERYVSYGLQEKIILRHSSEWVRNQNYVDMPLWAMKFVREIDAGATPGNAITAQVALGTLQFCSLWEDAF